MRASEKKDNNENLMIIDYGGNRETDRQTGTHTDMKPLYICIEYTPGSYRVSRKLCPITSFLLTLGFQNALKLCL